MVYTNTVIDLPDTFIGEHTYGIPKIIRLYPGCELTIGKFCSIADGVTFAFWGKHGMEDITTYPFSGFAQWPPVNHTEVLGEDIYVGNDIWFASNALIMQGVTIGDGAVIGAHSVVASDVRPYALVVGNPAREVRRRFSDEDIDKLLTIKWWNWDNLTIQQYLQYICNPKVDDLYNIWITEIKKG